MKIIRSVTAIAAAVSLCTLYLPFSAVAEYETKFIPIPVHNEENGTITTADGSKWYKVSSFDDDKYYIISVKSGDEDVLLTAGSEKNQEYVWRFYRRTMVTSTAPEYEILYTSSFYLTPDGNSLSAQSCSAGNDNITWEHDGDTLCFDLNGKTSYLSYDAASETPFSMTDDISEAAQVNIYTLGDTLERCISEHPHAESYVLEGSDYPAPEFSVKLKSDDITVDKATWFVDENEYPCDTLIFTADVLKDQPCGIHRVSCLVEAHDSNNIHYREKSANALFVIAKGVVPDSAITFSDVHEEYDLIGDAVGNVLDRTGGYIPALIICTGDLVNGPTPDSEKMLGKYYPQIISQLGGIDTVFVSGNHDPGAAASVMSEKAALTDEGCISDTGGLVFNGSSDAVENHGGSSKYNRDVKVFGINYDSEIFRNDGYISYSYENVIDDVDAFLKKTAEDYHGELVIISAHSGLHVLGKIKGSVSSNGNPVSAWIGENMYNVDKSYDLAALINSYAEKYDMNIMYLFGHDHSRLEEELILKKGDILNAPINYSELSYGTLQLYFTYAHAGYLSTVIGCADTNFSFIYRNGDDYSIDLIRLADNTVKHTDIASVYHAEIPDVTTTAEILTTTSDVSETTADTTVSNNSSYKTVTSASSSAAASKSTTSTNKNEKLPDTGMRSVAVPLTALCALIMINSGIRLLRKTENEQENER